MVSLLNHDELKKEKKSLLQRGPKVEVANQVKLSDIRGESSEQRKEEKIEVKEAVTEPVNIRVDNHIRNSVNAFITLGHADTQKELIEMVIASKVDGLDKSELKRYNELIEIYEKKDYFNSLAKNKKI